tara:strand:+ start:3092 stop:3355 length:264 start_codon:yes stop_codon:yes gene_type:complete
MKITKEQWRAYNRLISESDMVGSEIKSEFNKIKDDELMMLAAAVVSMPEDTLIITLIQKNKALLTSMIYRYINDIVIDRISDAEIVD